MSVAEARAFLRTAMPAGPMSDRELFELIVMTAVGMGLAVEFDAGSAREAGNDGEHAGSVRFAPPGICPEEPDAQRA